MFKKSISALTFAMALGGSVFVPAMASAQGVELKFYDKSHKDYHNWNTDEDRYYRQYLNEHHRKYTAFSHNNKSQQQAYWSWRHEHEGR
jgi:hypothetical protein